MSKQKKFIFALFYLAPFVDAANGYLIFNNFLPEGSLFSPGQILRFCITAFSFTLLNLKDFYKIVGLGLFFLIIEFISFNLHFNPKGFILGAVYSYKIIYFLLVFYSLKNIVSDFGIMKLIQLYIKSAVIYSVILWASTLIGISKSTYITGTFGSKGLFASGNGLSIFLGTSALIAYYYYQSFPKRNNLIYFILISISTILVGTKASIIFIFFILILFFYNASFKRKLVYIFVHFIVGLFYLKNIVSFFSTIFDVILYRYKSSSTFISFIASNRDNYIIDAFNHYNIDGFNLIRVFFGSGIFISFRNFSDSNLIYDTLESDLFDLFFAYGILGTIFYLGFIYLGFINILKKFNLTLFLAWLIIVSYSIIAGHVIFNAMSSIALISLFLIISLRNKHNVL